MTDLQRFAALRETLRSDLLGSQARETRLREALSAMVENFTPPECAYSFGLCEIHGGSATACLEADAVRAHRNAELALSESTEQLEKGVGV